MDELEGSLEIDRTLWLDARRLLASERSYSQEQIKNKLELYLRLTPELADRRFNLMVRRSVIIPTHGNSLRYYLGDTTPF